MTTLAHVAGKPSEGTITCARCGRVLHHDRLAYEQFFSPAAREQRRLEGSAPVGDSWVHYRFREGDHVIVGQTIDGQTFTALYIGPLPCPHAACSAGERIN